MKTSIFSNRITARWWWGSLAPLRRNGPAVRQRPVQVRASLGVGPIGLPSAIGGLLLLTLCLSLQAQSVIQFSAVSCRVTEETSQVDIIVQRTNDLETVVSVDFTTTTNGTAMAGADYVEVSTNLTFLANETNKTVAVPILNDSLVESSETFQVTLSNATVGAVLGTRTNATVRITDNDQGLAFEFARYSVAEDAGSVLIAVLRRDDGNFPVTVDYATTNLTAEAGQDYTETKGTLDFGVGETVQTITVPITYDEQREPDEKFSLFLSNPSVGVVLGTNRTATITILDTTGMVAHRFDRIVVLADQSVQLTLGGSVHTRFRSYLDLYPIEVSTNLVDWTPLVTLQRTNSSTNVFTYADPDAATSELRFYRTVASHLVTPLRQPTGPFAVGMISRLVNDPTRRNRYGVSTNGSFRVSIWYPAVAESAILPGRLLDEWLAKHLNWFTAKLGGAWLDRLPYVVSYALAGAKCAPNEAPYPIARLRRILM